MRHPIKHWHLLVLFLLALPCFVWVRWQPEPYLRQQLQLAGLKESVRFQRLEKRWFGIRLHDVVLRISPEIQLRFSSLEASPSWSSLLRGMPALHVIAAGENVRLTARVGKVGEALKLEDLDLLLPMEQVRQWVHVPMDVRGRIHAQGNLALMAGRLEQAEINVDWQQASLRIANLDYALGEYRLHLGGDAPAMTWNLSGGTDLMVEGQGKLRSRGGNPLEGMLSGEIQIQASGSMLALVQPFIGGAKRRLRLEGVLRQPRWQLLPTALSIPDGLNGHAYGYARNCQDVLLCLPNLSMGNIIRPILVWEVVT